MNFSKTITHHPALCRFIVMRYIAAACTLSGCVPATAYEQATSAAEVEREGHKRAAQRLARVEGELEETRRERDRLIAEKNDLLGRLSSEESRLAQVAVELENGQKETEQQEELVTQLRGELARVGEHIKVYAGQKSDLQSELEAAQLALEEKDKRISDLEAEVSGLKQNVEQAADAQEKLSGALNELSALQNEVDPDGANSETQADGADSDDEVLPIEEDDANASE